MGTPVTGGFGVGIGGGGTSPVVASIVASGSSIITITFTADIYVFDQALVASGWSVTPGAGVAVTVYGVTVGTDSITLETSEHTDGAVYTLNFPAIGIIDVATYGAFTGPFAQVFNGSGESPVALQVNVIDNVTVEVVFSEFVDSTEAKTPGNYVIPGLTVNSVSMVYQHVYRLVTSQQVYGIPYTITISNIHDMAGNLI